MLSFAVPIIRSRHKSASSLSSIQRILSAPAVSEVNSVSCRFFAYFSSGFLQKRGASIFTSATTSKKQRKILPVLFIVFFNFIILSYFLLWLCKIGGKKPFRPYSALFFNFYHSMNSFSEQERGKILRHSQKKPPASKADDFFCE